MVLIANYYSVYYFLQRPQCPPHEDVWVKWVNTDKKDTSKGNFVYTLKAHQSRIDNDGSYYESENYPSECQTPILGKPRNIEISMFWA